MSHARWIQPPEPEPGAVDAGLLRARRTWTGRRRRRRAAIAAGAVAPVLLGLMVWVGGPGAEGPPAGAVVVSRAEPVSVALADGVRVEVAPHSSMRWDRGEDGLVLRVEAGGAAFALTAPSRFQVMADDVEVRTEGARFTVARTPAGAVSVVVLAGRVEVVDPAADATVAVGAGGRWARAPRRDGPAPRTLPPRAGPPGAAEVGAVDPRPTRGAGSSDPDGRVPAARPVSPHARPTAVDGPPRSPDSAAADGPAAPIEPVSLRPARAASAPGGARGVEPAEAPVAPAPAPRASAGEARPDEAAELFAEARSALRRGAPAEAAAHLERLVATHPADRRAGLAAFELACLALDELGEPARALRALDVALRDGGAAFHEDAMARRVTALARAGADCGPARDAYRATYPDGAHRSRILEACPE